MGQMGYLFYIMDQMNYLSNGIPVNLDRSDAIYLSNEIGQTDT